MIPHRLSEFRRSVVRRYSLLLLASAVVPIFVVGLLYDRYARGLLDQFTGAQLDAQLAATSSRIGSFLEARTYQLETLARYPAWPAPGRGAFDLSEEMDSLVRIESDNSDLYGILFFSDQGRLVKAVAGQAGSGAPYWSELPFDVESLPRQLVGETTLIGPALPRDGRSGWFLLEEGLHGGGTIALHVRLASVTELLGAPSAAGVLQPVLRTPAGYLDALGRPAVVHGEIIPGPEVAPGWRPCLVVDPDELMRPFQAGRYALFAASVVTLAAIGWLLARMAGRLKHRVDLLAHGAEVLSAGDFSYRVPDAGQDEISFLAIAFNRMASKLGRLVESTVRMERLAALGEFSTGVAHEVRNPLATLKTTVQALARREADPQRSALLATMGGEIDRMGRAMEDILAFGRPRPPQRRAVPIGEVARRLRTLVATEAGERKVAFELLDGMELVASVDPDHFLQILMNLTLNALQATPPGGRVTLGARREGERLLVEVADTGPGMAPDRLRKVFEPFFTTRPGGTGLGLSISRQLADLNGGGLSLESRPGEGTRARLVLVPAGEEHV